MHEEGVPALDLGVGDLERDRLVGLRREQHVLPRAVGGLLALLEARHEPVARLRAARDLGVLDLEQQGPLVPLRVELLGHAVPGPPNLDAPFLHRHRRRPRRRRRGALGPLRLPRGALGEAALVPPALRVRQVVPLVLVHREAEAALVLPQVVAHEVGVFRDVDGLQGEAAEALAAVDVLLEKVGGGEERGGWVSEEREVGTKNGNKSPPATKLQQNSFSLPPAPPTCALLSRAWSRAPSRP